MLLLDAVTQTSECMSVWGHPVCLSWSALEIKDALPALLTIVGGLAALAFFYVDHRKSLKLQKTEIYQGLETASNDVFGYEAEHKDLLERFRDDMPNPERFSEQEWIVLHYFAQIESKQVDVTKLKLGNGHELDCTDAYERLEGELRVVRKLYEKTMNLFEVSARFRRQEIFEPEVFGSWVIWYFETCKEWAFRWWWPDLRLNYVAEIRNIFDIPVATFEFEQDEHGDEHDDRTSEATRQDAGEDWQHHFFTHVALQYDCGVVATWLAQMNQAYSQIHRIVTSQEEYRPAPSYEYPRKWRAKAKLPKLAYAKARIVSPHLDEHEHKRRPVARVVWKRQMRRDSRAVELFSRDGVRLVLMQDSDGQRDSGVEPIAPGETA